MMVKSGRWQLTDCHKKGQTLWSWIGGGPHTQGYEFSLREEWELERNEREYCAACLWRDEEYWFNSFPERAITSGKRDLKPGTFAQDLVVLMTTSQNGLESFYLITRGNVT